MVRLGEYQRSTIRPRPDLDLGRPDASIRTTMPLPLVTLLRFQLASQNQTPWLGFIVHRLVRLRRRDRLARSIAKATLYMFLHAFLHVPPI